MVDARQSHLGTSRIIATGLSTGVVLFWIVAWALSGGGSRPLTEGGPSADLLLLVWSAVAVPAFGAALYFRGRAARPPRRRVGEARDRGSGARTQVATIVAHALLEAPALLAGVLFLLYGATLLAWIAVPLYGLGAAMVWPRAEWFPHP